VACAATRDILPEKCALDGALLVAERILAPLRAGRAHRKSAITLAAKKIYDNAFQDFNPFEDGFFNRFD